MIRVGEEFCHAIGCERIVVAANDTAAVDEDKPCAMDRAALRLFPFRDRKLESITGKRTNRVRDR
jgi:hypothetical protein